MKFGTPDLEQTTAETFFGWTVLSVGWLDLSGKAGFRREAPGKRLYFEFDGHLNRDGSALLSDLLVPVIEEALASR